MRAPLVDLWHGLGQWRREAVEGGRSQRPGGFLDLFARNGQAFDGIGKFTGYNEIIIESDTWIRNLPLSVEAIFMIDCKAGDVNTLYTAADGHGTSKSCEAAKTRAIAMHRSYLQEYGLDARSFPLLKLRTTEWSKPFVSMPEVNADIVARAVAAKAGKRLPVVPSSSSSSSPPPSVTCHTCNAHRGNGHGLTSARCDAMLHEERFWSMWGVQGWQRRAANQPACFTEGWQHFEFETAMRLAERRCDRNWLEGVHEWPRSLDKAPALLGFDETIYAFCSAAIGEEEGPYHNENEILASRCTLANENVLRVMGGWNMCVNLQWQLCDQRLAARSGEVRSAG